MKQQIQNIEKFLEEDSKRAVDILDINEKKLSRKLTFSDLQVYGGLQNFLIDLSRKNPNINECYVQKYTPNGASGNGNKQNYKSRGVALPIVFKKTSSSERDVQETTRAVEAAAPVVSNYNQQHVNNQPMQHHNYPVHNQQDFHGMQGGMLGVHIKAAKYDELLEKHNDSKAELKEKIQEIKEDYKEVKADNKDLERQLREARSKIANFAEKLDLEKRLIEAGVKKTDYAELLEKLTPILTTALPMVSGSNQMAQSPEGMQGPELSSVKQSLIKVISDENFSDENALAIYQIIQLMSNPEFNNSVGQLIQNHNNQ